MEYETGEAVKELQKFFAIDVSATDGPMRRPVYDASEADAAFAAEIQSLQSSIDDLIEKRRRDAEAIKDIHAKHAKEVERLKAAARRANDGWAEAIGRVYKLDQEIERLKAEYDESIGLMQGQHRFDQEEIESLGKEIAKADAEFDVMEHQYREEIISLRKQAERYEKLRRLNVPQFQALFARNLKGDVRFDELVDQLPASGEAQK